MYQCVYVRPETGSRISYLSKYPESDRPGGGFIPHELVKVDLDDEFDLNDPENFDAKYTPEN